MTTTTRHLARLVLVALALLAACGPKSPQHEIVTLDDGTVSLPLDQVADGAVHFFTYRHEGKNVNFLVRSDAQGTLHTHLDACFSCYRYRRGFVVEEGDLVCIACRLTYPIAEREWDFQGACAPIPIHSTIEGGHLKLERAVLERAARYF